jgi:MYXO-CTERM domain-containing protein
VIRNNPQINNVGPGTTEFIINASGQKAGLGSNAINGSTIGQIQGLTITRFDDTTRFSAGSGPAVAPYLNIWVTDGLGNYAVLANEPSNGAFQPLFVDNGDGTKTYNLDFSDLASHPVQVYETLNGGYNSNNTWVHNLLGINGPLTFENVAGLMISAPSAAYITGPNSVGTGAPRELGTNVAYGVNWIFGDTLSNYQSGDDGYIVGLADVSAAAVPEPASIAVWSLVSVAGLAAWRRRKAAKAA